MNSRAYLTMPVAIAGRGSQSDSQNHTTTAKQFKCQGVKTFLRTSARCSLACCPRNANIRFLIDLGAINI